MTGAQWGILVPAVASFLVAAAAFLRAHTAKKTAVAASAKADVAGAAAVNAQSRVTKLENQ